MTEEKTRMILSQTQYEWCDKNGVFEGCEEHGTTAERSRVVITKALLISCLSRNFRALGLSPYFISTVLIVSKSGWRSSSLIFFQKKKNFSLPCFSLFLRPQRQHGFGRPRHCHRQRLVLWTHYEWFNFVVRTWKGWRWWVLPSVFNWTSLFNEFY